MAKVQIIGGRSGQVLPYLIEQIGPVYRGGARVLMIVPEQYTLQAERELIARLELSGFFDLDVLSPSRLNKKIRETAGQLPLLPLDSRGRSMAIARALRSCADELHYYRRVAASPGLPGKISNLLTDMEHAGLDPETLAEQADRMPLSATKAKLGDLAVIWRRYLQVIEGRFADEAAQRSDLLARLPESGVVNGAYLFVYGFDVLRRPFCDLLTAAAPLCAGITVGMTMDDETAPDARVFLTQRRSAQRLADQLREAGIASEWNYLPGSCDEKDPALAHLEKCLFARERHVFDGNAGCIEVHESANPFAEAAYCAQTLTRWHDSGIPWSSMAIALASPVSPALMQTLASSGIPAYLSQSESVLHHGLIRMLLSSLRAVSNGYRREDVLAAARSGFTAISRDEADILENYALEHGINRYKWTREFTRGDNAEEAESLRTKLMGPLITLHDSLRSAKTAAGSVSAIYALLEDTHAYAALRDRERMLIERGFDAEAVRNRQIWRVIIELLDQMHALLGDSKAMLKEAAEFVEAALTSTTLNAFPPTAETVMVGEAGHLMTSSLDALIVTGMQDGMLQSGMDSLLSDDERVALSESVGRAVGVTRLEQNALRLSDFYRTLSLPSRFLVMSCALSEADGTALRPSVLLDDAKNILPGLQRTGGIMQEMENSMPIAPMPALEELSLQLRALADGRIEALNDRWQDALRWLCRSETYRPMVMRLLQTIDPKAAHAVLPGKTAVSLFGGDKVSISRLERYAECPYHYYVDYGLKPAQRKEFVYQPSDAGSFYHEVLEKYAAAAMTTPEWPNIPDDEVDRMLEGILQPMTAGWEGGPLRDDAMGCQLGEAYVRDVKRAAMMYTRHARNSSFTTIGTEITFGEADGGLPPVVLELSDGRRIALRGKIDRIDRYEGDSGVYLRVIDYKSSDKQLNDTKMWYGLQLQLLLYLKAATDGTDGAKPAGAFYFKVDDPVVEAEEDITEIAEKAIANALRLNGIALADVEVLDAMDTGEKEFSLHKMTKKEGFTNNAIDAESMQLLLDHAQDMAVKLSEEIRTGRIDVSPASTDGEWNACIYCDYADICGIDPLAGKAEYRQLETLKRDDLVARLKEKNLPDEAEQPVL